MGKSQPDGFPRARRQIRGWRAVTRVQGERGGQGGRGYERWRCLPRLIRVEFNEIDDSSAACGREIIARLSSAIDRERRRARMGHWSYDVNRHIALLRARREEISLLTTHERRMGRCCEEPPANENVVQAVAATGTILPTDSCPDRRTALLTGTKASCDRIMVTEQPSSDSGSRNQNWTR